MKFKKKKREEIKTLKESEDSGLVYSYLKNVHYNFSQKNHSVAQLVERYKCEIMMHMALWFFVSVSEISFKAPCKSVSGFHVLS